MPSLYAAGWRQGSVLEAELESCVLVVTDQRQATRTIRHPLWMVVTQDCDLALVDRDPAEPRIELRPLFDNDPPPTRGIRARKLRVAHDRRHYLVADSFRLIVSADVLTMIIDRDPDRRRDWLDMGETLALQTWLGLRYDRPAVPEALVPLTRAIAEMVDRQKRDPALATTRDVLVQFDRDSNPPLFLLVALVEVGADQGRVRDILIEAGRRVSPDYGVLRDVVVGTAAQISVELLENSQAVDLTQITWATGRPEGAA